MLFKLWLISLKLQPQQYINMVKNKMAEFDYGNDVYFSDLEQFKLYIVNNENGRIYFGTNNLTDDIINSLLLCKEILSFDVKTKQNQDWINSNIMPLVGRYSKFHPLIIEFYLLWT